MGYNENIYKGSMGIYIGSMLLVIFCMIKSSVYRSPITITAFLSLLSALIYAIMIVTISSDEERLNSMRGIMSSFYVTSISLAYVPGLIGLRRIAKETGSRMGVWIATIGYLWAFILIVIAIVLNVMIGKNILSMTLDSVYVMLFGHSGHTFLLIVLYLMTQKHLHGKDKGSLVAYVLLFVQYEIFYYVLTYTVEAEEAYNALSLVFNDLVMALALLISVWYGRHWTTKSDLKHINTKYNKVEAGTAEEEKLKG